MSKLKKKNNLEKMSNKELEKEATKMIKEDDKKREFSWTYEEILLEIEDCHKGQDLIVKHCRRGKKSFRDIRFYYYDKDNVRRPGKGICIPVDFCDEVADAIMKITKDEEENK